MRLAFVINFNHVVAPVFLIFIGFRQGKCKKKELGLGCEVGMRRKTVYVLAGSVLSIWTKIGVILSNQSGSSGKMQIIRVRLDDGTKIVGKHSKVIYLSSF